MMENNTVKGLVDSGAQVSSISDTFAKKLGLQIQKLETLLELEPTGGGTVPYDGYVEVRLKIPNVRAFDLDILMLVIPESQYARKVPITLGTIHIDEIINVITDAELHNIDKSWQRGIISRKIAIRTAQIKEKKSILAQVKGDVKLTRPVKIPAYQTISVSGMTNVTAHSKRVNVVTEPGDGNQYTVPCYSYMRPGSRRANVVLRNLTGKSIELKRGLVVAQIQAANKVPPMLQTRETASERATRNPRTKSAFERVSPRHNQNNQNDSNNTNEKGVSTDEPSSERIEKLFSKIDLSGADDWSEESRSKLRSLFVKYHGIFALEDLELGRTNIVKHKIVLEDPKPFCERYRRIPPHQYQEVKEHLKQMLEIGAIRKSNSPWASAVVLVRKKDGALRFCIDLRKLNTHTVKDAQTLLRIEDSLDSLNGAVIFTSLDLKSGYWQVELDEESMPYTAFTVGPLGFYECLRMPFGFTNAPATFQRLMESCLGDLHLNWCIIYLDDIIIYSKTPEEHIERLEGIFAKLQKAGLTLKPSKCEFLKSRITYLGHIVSKNGIETDPKKISAVQQWPRPTTVTQVRKFLGFTNYYRKFLQYDAKIAKPLHLLTSGDNANKKRSKIVWTEDCESAFTLLKGLCSNTPVLAYPDYLKEFKLYTEASDGGLGAVLTQISEDGKERPVAFASRTLSKSEKNYDAHKLEFLALRWAVTDHFHEYLYGGTFEVYTDNNPLTYVLTTAKLDAIGQRWVASLAPYNFSLFYNPGRQNIVADSLSRIPWDGATFTDSMDYNIVKAMINKGESNTLATVEPEVIYPDLTIQMHQVVSPLAGKLSNMDWKKEQMDDAEIGPVLRLVRTKKHLQYKFLTSDSSAFRTIMRFRMDLRIVDDLLYRKWVYKNEVAYLQFLLPVSFRKKTVMACHDHFGHLGMDKTLVLLQERFFWPKMNDDVHTHIRNCDRCLRFKQTPEKDEMQSIETTYPMELVHMDFLTIGSKLKGDNEVDILVITDHFTRYAQAFTCSAQMAAVVATTLYEKFLVHYGWPERLLSDQGGNFESKLIAELCRIGKVQKCRTTPYHPQGNGQCEKFNRTLLSMIGTLEPNQKGRWQDYISSLTQAYNSSRCDSTGFSPYYLMFGRMPRLPIDVEYGVTQPEIVEKSRQNYARKLRVRLNWAFKIAKEINEKESARQKRFYDKRMRCQKLVPGDMVLVKQKGSSGTYKIDDKWETNPYQIIEQCINDKGKPIPVFKLKEIVQDGKARLKTLHRNMLYPYRSVLEGDSPLLMKCNMLMDIYFSER